MGPNWLTTPHRYLMQNPNTTVNFINFSLEASVYLPKRAWHGIGSSATISADLRQFWGGGSKEDNTSPITMGMFATSKYWWNQGTMDPLLRVWGGENVEISLRYDLISISIVEPGFVVVRSLVHAIQSWLMPSVLISHIECVLPLKVIV